MSGKRPSTTTNSSYGAKKPRQDFDNFKPPLQPANAGNSRPQFNENQNQQSSKQASVKIQQPPAKSIVDKDEWDNDDDDDEIFYIASQNAEEAMNQKRQQMSEEINNQSYYAFKPIASGTSTQNVFTTGYTEHIRANLFVDVTRGSETARELPNTSQQINTYDGQPGSSSQKENISARQTMTKQQNQIKALQIQINNLKSSKTEIQEKLQAKEGEALNLRNNKKHLEDQISAIQLQRMKEVDLSKNDPEKDRMRKEIENLKTQIIFNNNQDLNATFSRRKPEIPVEIVVEQTIDSKTATFTSLQVESTIAYKDVPSGAFETEKNVKKLRESKVIAWERKVSAHLVETQMRLAQVHGIVLAGQQIDDAFVEEIFREASLIVRNLSFYIKFLESGSKKEITFDSDPALTACALISIPAMREKLTIFDSVRNTLDMNDGFLSIYQSEKLYPEEKCSKLRRIIALYSTLARHSKSFSRKLLLDKVSDGLEESDRDATFLSIWVGTLKNKISQSETFYDYFGVIIASASLLSSLSRHYDLYESNICSIDEILGNFFRAVLDCQCNTPTLMRHLSQFLANVSKNPDRTGLTEKLCVNYPRTGIIFSAKYKHCKYSREACSFELFLRYLLTSFDFNSELNRIEFEILLDTALNLNKITSNIQAMKFGTCKFLHRTENMDHKNSCSCFSMLINALLLLNHLAIVYREKAFLQEIPNRRKHLEQSNEEKLIKGSFNKYHPVIYELTRNFITLLADLFQRTGSMDFPIEKLVFADRLEEFCIWMNYETCPETNEKKIFLADAKDLNDLIDMYTIISVKPNILIEHSNSGQNNGVEDDVDQITFQASRCLISEELSLDPCRI